MKCILQHRNTFRTQLQLCSADASWVARRKHQYQNNVDQAVVFHMNQSDYGSYLSHYKGFSDDNFQPGHSPHKSG